MIPPKRGNDEPSAPREAYAHIKVGRGAAALRGVFWSGINSAVPTIASSLVFVVSSRYLTPTDFGLVALAGGIGAFASALAPAAFGEAIVQRLNVETHHLDTVFWLCVQSALTLYLALVLGADWIADYVRHPEIATLILVLGLRVIFDLFAAVPQALITRSMAFNLIAYRTIVATLVSSALCLTLIALDYGLWALALSQLSSSAVSCLAAFWNARWRPGFDVRLSSLRDLGRYGIYASGNRFLSMMSLDQIIIGAFAGAAMLGIYNFAKRLYSMLHEVITGALYSVAYTLMSSLQNQRETVRDAFLLTTFGSAVVSFPAFFGLGAIAGDAIPLIFGDQWINAVAPVRWFCLIGIFSCVGAIQAALITSQGKSNWWFYYFVVQQLGTIVVIALTHQSGVDIIIMYLALKTLLIWPVSVYMSLKIINVGIFSYIRQFSAPIIASIVMTVVILYMRSFIIDEDIYLRLLYMIATGAIIYALMIAVLAKARLRYAFNLLIRRKKS